MDSKDDTIEVGVTDRGNRIVLVPGEPATLRFIDARDRCVDIISEHRFEAIDNAFNELARREAEAVMARREADRAIRVDDLCLGSTNPLKVIHHRRCHHARTDYIWAREQGDIYTLAEALISSGALGWHKFCGACCGDVEDYVRQLQRTR